MAIIESCDLKSQSALQNRSRIASKSVDGSSVEIATEIAAIQKFEAVLHGVPRTGGGQFLREGAFDALNKGLEHLKK